MKAYVQFANGQEVELVVREPDPKDGTFTLFLENSPSVVLDDDGNVWIRIVPNE